MFHKQTEEQHSSQQLVKTRIKQSIIALYLDCKKIGPRTHECDKNIKALVDCLVLLRSPSTTGTQDVSEEWQMTRNSFVTAALRLLQCTCYIARL